MSNVVVCEGVVKRYGSFTAVNDVSFEVHEGEIFGMIGPNGAGKTTLMECTQGLRQHDSGRIEVLGLDPHRDTRRLRELSGVQLQSSALPSRTKVREALQLFASFYRNPVDWRALLERLNLLDKAETYVEKLSGGQRQRVFIALALINNPKLVFLDELTTGLDPQARLNLWEVIEDIRAGGTTVFLTTHFMEEAERLCDRVAIIDTGRIVALDSVPGLVHSLGVGTRMTFRMDSAAPVERLERVPGVTQVEQVQDRVTVHGSGERFPQEVIGVLAKEGLWAKDIKVEQASLETAFLELTGGKREARTAQQEVLA